LNNNTIDTKLFHFIYYRTIHNGMYNSKKGSKEPELLSYAHIFSL
jgi:hypothetical protein